MLSVHGIKKTFGRLPVLSGLDMEVEDGMLYGFVGANGAGKTTAIRIITGLLKPDEGTVEISGINALEDRAAVCGLFGYVPDEFGMYNNLKVWEYMDFFAAAYGIYGLTARTRCGTLLEQVKLSDKADEFVDSLSRGMKQRLCLARALIHDPKLLILDEPASGMDPASRMEFKETLKELCAEGKTILISSHILPELSSMCTDIAILDSGRIVLSGSMDDILKKVDESNPISISVSGNMGAAVKLLREDKQVSALSIDGNRLSVRYAGMPGSEAGLLKKLIMAGVPVTRFSREQGDLESIFMRITGHEDEKVVQKSEE